MRGVNKAIVAGHLGADPDVKATRAGGLVCNLRLASKDSYKGEEQTEWHRIVCFNKLAETCEQYLKQGSPVLFIGKIQTRKWTDQQGNTRESTEILAHEMEMLGKAPVSDQPKDYPEKGNQLHHPVNDEIPF